jgi:Tol biopolymer transport system component
VGDLSFSRDGKRFAFGSLDWRSTLYRAPLDAAGGRLAGPPMPLLKGMAPIRDHQLSPDGEWLVVMRLAPQEDLFVSRVDGTQSRRLTDDAHRDRGPAWSPDGQRIAFYSDRGGSYQLWIIRADGSGLEQATAIENGTANFPIWSPDGKRIALSIIPTGGQVIDTGALPAAPKPLPRVGEGLAFWPLSWSRDGRRLGGIVVRDSGTLENVTVLDLETGKYEPLAREGSRQWRIPVWLSDSRRLVMRDGRGIWLVDPGRGEPRRLVLVGGYATGMSVGVSRDDRWLTWSETGTEGDVWVAEFE